MTTRNLTDFTMKYYIDNNGIRRKGVSLDLFDEIVPYPKQLGPIIQAVGYRGTTPTHMVLHKRKLSLLDWTLPNDLGDRKEFNGLIGRGKHGGLKKFCDLHEIDISSYKGEQRRDKIVRNLVDFEAGKTIFQTALGIIEQKNHNQTQLFT